VPAAASAFLLFGLHKRKISVNAGFETQGKNVDENRPSNRFRGIPKTHAADAGSRVARRFRAKTRFFLFRSRCCFA